MARQFARYGVIRTFFLALKRKVHISEAVCHVPFSSYSTFKTAKPWSQWLVLKSAEEMPHDRTPDSALTHPSRLSAHWTPVSPAVWPTSDWPQTPLVSTSLRSFWCRQRFGKQPKVSSAIRRLWKQPRDLEGRMSREPNQASVARVPPLPFTERILTWLGNFLTLLCHSRVVLKANQISI